MGMINDNKNVLGRKVCGIHDVTILPRIWKAVEVSTQFPGISICTMVSMTLCILW